LMRRMGIEALYRRPQTSKPGAGHRRGGPEKSDSAISGFPRATAA
jgi:hypothetical protein